MCPGDTDDTSRTSCFMMNVMREKNKVCNLKSSSGVEDVGILGNLDVRLNSFFFFILSWGFKGFIT